MDTDGSGFSLDLDWCVCGLRIWISRTHCSSTMGLGSRLGLEEVFMFDSKSENRDRAVEAVESLPEARAYSRLGLC